MLKNKEDFVDFPINGLDLTKYVKGSYKEKPIYNLYAVINHKGTTINGHYFAYTKHYRTQRWYFYDDHKV
jgi:ubiquitin carboxyl-terminal hydrolase 4/11/15